MSIRKKTLNFLSTAFLVVSLIVAGGLVSAGAFASQDAKASANTQDHICAKGLQCLGVPTNCLCEIVITPEEN